MALKKTLAQRLFNISTQTLSTCRISSAAAAAHADRIVRDPSRSTIDPDPGDRGVFRRFLHRRAVLPPLDAQLSPLGRENLMDKLRSLDIARNRIRLDGLIPPPSKEAPDMPPELTAEESRKILKVAQMEMIKSKLREIRKIWIPYEEFVRVCGDGFPDPEEGVRIGQLLDESGNVVVLGNMVLLQPELVTKAMAGIMPHHQQQQQQNGVVCDDRRMTEELETLEKQKAEIDRAAETKVRAELWVGLCGLVVQTTAFMRLTFWELSWDVMEPICFFVTSGYCGAAFTFYLLTRKEPSFENLFHVRFLKKQKKLMEARKFDMARYQELKTASSLVHNSPYPCSNSSITSKLEMTSFSSERPPQLLEKDNYYCVR